jgi:hypothetical protein
MLDECPDEVGNAWGLHPIENPFNHSQTRRRFLFSGPGLLSMQSQMPNLAVTSVKDHISYLTNMGRQERRAAEALLEKARQEALEKQKKKDGTPKKSPIKSQLESLPIRSDEEQKLRKVVQHELDHYDLSKPESPRKRPKPVLLPPLTPPSSPPTSNLKSILKVAHTPDDIEESSPLKKITIYRTASAKLNYLLSRIQELQKTEKIIVFSDYGPMMWYLGEALEILGIEHLIYIQRLVLIFNLNGINCRCLSVDLNILLRLIHLHIIEY